MNDQPSHALILLTILSVTTLVLGLFFFAVVEPRHIIGMKKLDKVVVHISSSNPIGTLVAVDSKMLMELYAKHGWLIDSELNGSYIMRKVEDRND